MTLTGNKFFFVLDDVWSDNYLHWDSLRRPFESGAHGSMIFVTTRSEGAASMMGTFQAFRLKQISDKHSWLLFEKHAFNRKGVPAPSNLEEIGRQVARKCQGLPLAIKALGGLLCSYRSEEEWKSILNSDIWEVERNVMPALLLSYRYLPQYLKRCFAYCSMFPGGYIFERAELISLWKAEDLIPSTNMKSVEEVGEEYFNDLVSKSFFQPYQLQPTDNKAYHIMHDLINALAKFVSGEFCVRWEDSDSSTVAAKTRHFSYMKLYAQSNEKFEALQEAISLRTFLPLTQKMQIQAYRYGMRHEVLNDLLPTLRCLRALNLSEYDIKLLPDSINNLVHLRHLNMSSTSILVLPESICTLCNLQELLLADCKSLAVLPINLGRLIKLTHLDLEGTNLRKMPAQMGNLKDLKILDKFVLHNEHDVLELKKLQNLRGTLCISGIGFIVYGTDGSVLEANILTDKKFLTEVVMNWVYLPDGLPKLTGKLSLDSFPMLKILNIVLTWLSLAVSRSPNKLLALTSLTFCDCPEIVSFPDGRLHALNLTELDIHSCQHLRSMPKHMNTLLPCLQQLRISNSQELESFPEGRLPSKLQLLEITSRKLIANHKHWGLDRLTSLVHLSIVCQEYEEHVELFPEGVYLAQYSHFS
ncbi:hypothetical protein ACLB2K_067285 [Fragaria x ananassa]